MIQQPTINRRHKSGRKARGSSQFEWWEQHENRDSWSEPWQFTLILLQSVVFQDNFHLSPSSSSAHLHILLQKFGSHWQPSNSAVKHLCLNQMCVFFMLSAGTARSKWETLISPNNTAIDSYEEWSIPVKQFWRLKQNNTVLSTVSCRKPAACRWSIWACRH